MELSHSGRHALRIAHLIRQFQPRDPSHLVSSAPPRFSFLLDSTGSLSCSPMEASVMARFHAHSQPLFSSSPALSARSAPSLSISNPRPSTLALGLDIKNRFVTRCSVDGAVKVEAEVPVEKSWFLSCYFASRSVIYGSFFLFSLLKDLIFIGYFEGFPPFPTVMDINQIRNILPHR